MCTRTRILLRRRALSRLDWRVAVNAAACLLLWAVDGAAQAPPHVWSDGYGSTSGDQGHGVATDALGNTFVTGHFVGTVDFGGGDLVSDGGKDMFLAKYNANGAHVWSRRFGSTGSDEGYAVAVDGSNNVLVAGIFENTVDFGGAPVVSNGFRDIFVAKYDANGMHQWSRGFGSTSSDQGYALAVDGPGNAVVTGFFLGTVDFGGGNLVDAGSGDVFPCCWGRGGGPKGPDGADLNQ